MFIRLMNCNKTSNNKYFDCPALMSDGRAFTDYHCSHYTNGLIREVNGVKSSYEARQFMINNAETLMKANNEYMKLKNGCASCEWNQGIPVQTTCIYNRNYGQCKTTNPDGLGITNYATPDQKLVPYQVTPIEYTKTKLISE